MSAARILTLAESEEIHRGAQSIAATAKQMALDFGVVLADRDRLRLAHHLQAASLAELRDAFARGDTAELPHLVDCLIRHAEVHAYGAVIEPLPAGVADLDEVRADRLVASLFGGAQ